ncbi:MAG: hypothetical protein AB7O63_08550 [Reyranellaceae bacterium]
MAPDAALDDNRLPFYAGDPAIMLRRLLPILALLLLPLPSAAQTTEPCRAMAGTYLATIANGTGDYASRALITLFGDGNLHIVDSSQDVGLQGSSFSTQSGAWRCSTDASAAARTLNFGFPPRGSVARSDWTLAYDGKAPNGVTLKGTIALHIFPGVKDVDPFRADSKPVDTFRFTAIPVAAR